MVLDLETTGLHLKRDLVIAIGAVVIEDGAIDYSQQFECTLCRQVKVNESVLIHGIAPSELANRLPPAEALLSFMGLPRAASSWPFTPPSTNACWAAR